MSAHACLPPACCCCNRSTPTPHPVVFDHCNDTLGCTKQKCKSSEDSAEVQAQHATRVFPCDPNLPISARDSSCWRSPPALAHIRLMPDSCASDGPDKATERPAGASKLIKATSIAHHSRPLLATSNRQPQNSASIKTDAAQQFSLYLWLYPGRLLTYRYATAVRARTLGFAFQCVAPGSVVMLTAAANNACSLTTLCRTQWSATVASVPDHQNV